MKLLVLIIVLALVIALVMVAVQGIHGALKLPRWLRAKRPWYSDTSSLPDGSTVVQVRREGEAPRVVKELPAGMDPIDFKIELEDALLTADDQVRTLNRKRR